MQPRLGGVQEALDPVDVVRASDELVLAVVDTEVLRVPDIDQPVVAAPAVRVDDDLRRHAATDNGLKRGFLVVRHDLRVDLARALQEAEDNGLARGSAASLAAHAPGTEVALIDLDMAGGKW